jgi:hypothetical protein
MFKITALFLPNGSESDYVLLNALLPLGSKEIIYSVLPVNVGLNRVLNYCMWLKTLIL